MSDFENMIRDNEERKRLANEREDDLRSLATAIHSGFASKLGCKAAELRYEFVGLEPNSKNVPTCFEFDLTIVQLGKTLRVVIFHRRDHYDIELWNTHAGQLAAPGTTHRVCADDAESLAKVYDAMGDHFNRMQLSA